MKQSAFENYFTSPGYISYTVKKLRQGGLWRSIYGMYKQIRKYTLISGIIKTFYFIMLLLEKSAVLLLLVSAMLFLLPIVIVATLLYSILCILKYLKHNGEIKNWLLNANKITVYLTNEKIFSNEQKLFLRVASSEAAEYSHPVIILCSDKFISLKWYGINLLGIRSDYFFVIKKHFLSKTPSIINYIVIN